MSDTQTPCSKAAKKNKKRNSKKSGMPLQGSEDAFNPELMLTHLKTLLEEAKLNKEHAQAATLRNQIWVLKDLINGVRTQIPEDDLNKIIESIHSQFNSKPSSTTAEEVKPVVGEQQTSSISGRLSAAGSSSSDLDDRKLRNLRKKLRQIEALKEQQQRGDKLEENQMEKIRSESKVKEEIQELEDLLKELMK